MNELDIKSLREKLGLSQAEFGKKLGVCIRTVQNWESGMNIPFSKRAILRNMIEGNQLPELRAPVAADSKTVLVDRDVLNTIISQQKTIASQQKMIERLLNAAGKRGALEEDPAGCAGAAGA